MQAVRSKDTLPELRVRRMVHAMGYRYALHRRDLPGSPDLTLVSRRRLIFVHGCFWHSHSCKAGQKVPVRNATYWSQKRLRNAARDRAAIKSARRLGWSVLVVWECQTTEANRLHRLLQKFLTKPF